MSDLEFILVSSFMPVAALVIAGVLVYMNERKQHQR